ncbi:MAG: biosynthetic-type acetolactate synthase large subunit [Chloroflexi bacterium]|nr:biosynthetic-type acetolactate synthase large subunit [Chloroflexota bacterium]
MTPQTLERDEQATTDGSRPGSGASSLPKTGSALLCEALKAHGVRTVFGYPGGAALPLYRELANHEDGLRHLLVRHEENAALAADGYARATGFPGVCMATSGPGATNLLTGIATAMMDSVPVLALTGQVASSVIGTQAFQEVDIVGMARPVVKAALQAQRPEEVPGLVAEAFRIMREGRPGPVLLDLPKDVLMGTATVEQRPLAEAPRKVTSPTLDADLDRVAALLDNAERPVLAVGRGVLLAAGEAAILALAERLQAPVVSTLLGIGAMPESHPLMFGMAGMHGTVAANMALHHADLILGLGMRFDDRWVGRAADFAPEATIVHVDVDPVAFGRVARCDVPVLGDAGLVLDGLLARVSAGDRADWLARLRLWDADHADCLAPRFGDEMESGEVLRALKEVTGGAATLVADVGQHQMFVALHTGFDRSGSFFTSGGLGTMGYAVPASMGIAVARPGEEVWAIVGDGGFQMSAPELTTLAVNQLPVKMLILNNGCLGMVRQWQELFYDNVYSHSVLPHPDFAKLAEAHGVPGRTVTRREELREALAWARTTPGPVLLEVRVQMEETVLPMVPAGAATGEMICLGGRVLPE